LNGPNWPNLVVFDGLQVCNHPLLFRDDHLASATGGDSEASAKAAIALGLVRIFYFKFPWFPSPICLPWLNCSMCRLRSVALLRWSARRAKW